MTDIAKLKALRERYSPQPAPKCAVCGAEMTAQRIYGSRITYGCTGATYDNMGCRYAPGRTFVDEHYEQSQVTIVDVSDPDVLELISALEAMVAAHMNLKLLADVYRQAYEEARARTVTVELPRGYVGPYGSLVYDADAVEAALEAAERQKGYLREQCNEWERKAISNFENCSEMAARIEELESQRQMAFMASNRWADKFREAEKLITELEERNAEILRQARSFREAHESASEIIRKMERSKPQVTLPTTRLWAGKVACFEEGEVISALVAAGINLETGGE